MEDFIVRLPQDLRKGMMNRRELIRALGLTGTAALAATALPKATALFAAEGKAFPVTTINHLALACRNYVKSRDFYVDLFTMRVRWDDGKGAEVQFGSRTLPNGMYIRPLGKPTDKPGVGHFAFGTPNVVEDKDAMKAEMERRGLTEIRPDGEHGWIANDPAGYMLNTWVGVIDPAMYPGAGATCVEAASEKCKAGWEAGLKNLSSVPKASGKGFKATYFSHIILNVPKSEIAKERDFYSGMYGMKVISDKANGSNPEVVLGFNKNTLYLRPTANPSDKPYCVEYGFVIQNYDKAKVKAELDRRGVGPEADADGWTFRDPDGLKIGIYAA